jgi:hypothetical protein
MKKTNEQTKPRWPMILAQFLGTLSAIESFEGIISVAVTKKPDWSREAPVTISARLTGALNEELRELAKAWYEDHYPLPHTKDSDCVVDRRTECCRVCGVDHSGKCSECSGRGFHLSNCSTMAGIS